MNCKTNTARKLITTLFAVAFAGGVHLSKSMAQEGGSPEGDKPNPLEGLFTPQPQYPTPQTIMNPEPVPLPGQESPIKAMFTPQPQYPTPQTIMNPQSAEPPGQTNPLYGLYTPQPQYPTPQTIMNPEPTPKNFNPESAPSQPLIPPAPPPTTAPAQPAKKPASPAKKQPGKKKAPAKKGKKEKKAQQAQPPAPPPVYNPLKDALFNLNLGQYDSAIGIVNKLLESDPNNGEAHYVKAVALVYQQKFADAAYEYHKVMSINPNSELAARAAEGLKRISH